MAITIYPEKYYDDFNTPDQYGLTPEQKNYLRILFKPGQTVQARELNQAQSILQDQVDKLGSGLFKSGSPIVGGGCNFNKELYFIDVSIPSSFNITFFDWLNDSLGNISLQQSGTTLEASIVTFEDLNPQIVDTSQNKEYRLFIQYTSDFVQTGKGVGIFNETEITIENQINELSFVVNILNNGKAVAATLLSGLFFVKGTVVSTLNQIKAITLSDDEETFTGFAVLKVREDTINFSDDRTLLDNSNKTSNFAAPGADRYQINLELDLVKDETEDLSNIILLGIQDSNVISENIVEDNISPLNDILAKRTHEESGDYIINPFSIEIRDIWGGENELEEVKFNGIYKNLQDLNDAGFSNISTTNSQYGVTLHPSTAYVKGYRVNLPESINLFADRARDLYSSQNNDLLYETAINADQGFYIEGVIRKTDSGLPNFDYNQNYNLYNVDDTDIGDCTIMSVESMGEDNTGAAKVRLYFSKIKLDRNAGWRIKDISYISPQNAITGLGQMHFDVTKINGRIIHDTGINNSLFRLPYGTVSRVESLSLTEKRILSSQIDQDGNFATFTADDGGYIDRSKTNLIVMVDNGDNTFTFISQSEYSIDYEAGTADSLTIDLGGNHANKEIKILASIQGEVANGALGVKRKTVVTDLDLTDKLDSPEDKFEVGDIVTLNGVYHLISIESPDWIVQFDGQSKNNYWSAKVKCVKEGAETISFTHWDFIGTGNYYTVNSYQDVNGNQASLDLIPNYKSIPLSDTIDTRLAPSASDRLSLDPYSPIELEMDFYLPRRDILTVNTTGIFSIIKGEPSIKPEFPIVPNDALVLYKLFLNPYTFNVGDITKERIDNRRYTMRDISKLDKRLSNVEYYTSLSLLEKSAKDASIYDTDGLERFKNGFIVDGFRGHTVGNISEKYYKCSVDRQKGQLYPYHFGTNVSFDIVDDSQLEPNSDFPLSCSTKRVIGFPYKEVTWVNQKLATQFISVQPYEVINSEGLMELNPEVDTWVDTKTDPAIETDLFGELNTTIRDLAEAAGVLGTEHSTWQTRRSQLVGTRSETNILSESSVDLTDWESQGITWENTRSNTSFFNNGRGWRRTTTSTGFEEFEKTQLNTSLLETNVIQTTRELQTRTRTTTSLTEDSIKKSLGTFLTDVQYLPYMRSRRVYVRVEDLKKNTKYYAFFDGIDVTRFVSLYTGSTNVLDLNPNVESNRGFRFYNRRFLGASNGRTFSPGSSQDLISDEDGVIQAVFIIPNTPDLKFSSGEKVLKFTDSPRNLESEETSSAIAKYISNGLSATQQESIISTSVPRLVSNTRIERRNVNVDRVIDTSLSIETEEETITRRRDRESTTVRRHDPVAQTFFVGGAPGIYVTSVDVYFNRKGSRNVKAYLVTVKNGYPTNEIIPGSQVILKPSEVSVSDNSSVPTKFEFKKPLYLSGKTEYAVVVFSVDPEYTVYIAEMGGDKVDLITNQIISKQPAVGTFFTSSNKRTWTAEQNRDLKFKLRRAQFKTGKLSVKAQPRVGSFVESITVTNGGTGYTDTTEITIEEPIIGYDSATGDPQFDPNGQQAEAVAVINPVDGSITDIIITNEGTGYVNVPNVTITDPGRIIDGNTLASATAILPNIKVAAANLHETAISIGGKTTISNYLNLSGKKYHITPGDPIQLNNNKNHFINAFNAEETELEIIIGTSDNRVTPMIERNTIALEARTYFISPQSDNIEDQENTSQYYTKKITLEDPADQIDIYAAINRPYESAKAEFFIQLYDEDNEIVLNQDAEEWWKLTPTEPGQIPLNSKLTSFSDVLFRKNFEDSDIDFTSFILKIVMWGENNTDIVSIKDLRIIATA